MGRCGNLSFFRKKGFRVSILNAIYYISFSERGLGKPAFKRLKAVFPNLSDFFKKAKKRLGKLEEAGRFLGH
ncbi:MAG: hypothetical protein A2007_04310 [Verrucomicrobia bacterium GWC2_42_7]|nr:MAG: hypothetical protein A2007_04310 [Verrucomicrobia bacterium GWC2_42_7]